MWKLPRSILVYWLPRLWSFDFIVPFFVTVVTCNLSNILLSPATDFCPIDSNGRVWKIFGFPKVPLVLMLLLYLILFGLIGRLRILSGSRRRRGDGTLSSEFVLAIHRSLGLDFVRDSLSRSTPLEDLYISFSYVGTWSYDFFGLSSHHFC